MIVTLGSQTHTYSTFHVWFSLGGTQSNHLFTRLANYYRKFRMEFIKVATMLFRSHTKDGLAMKWDDGFGEGYIIGHDFWCLFLEPHLIINHSNTHVQLGVITKLVTSTIIKWDHILAC
jgi:hypothetical protein